VVGGWGGDVGIDAGSLIGAQTLTVGICLPLLMACNNDWKAS